MSNSGQNATVASGGKITASAGTKKPYYERPKIVDLGTLAGLTDGGAGDLSDGGTEPFNHSLVG